MSFFFFFFVDVVADIDRPNVTVLLYGFAMTWEAVLSKR